MKLFAVAVRFVLIWIVLMVMVAWATVIRRRVRNTFSK